MINHRGRYYLIANYEGKDNITHFRLDRFGDVQILDEKRRPINSFEAYENGLDLSNLCWKSNGCDTTLAEFRGLSLEKRQDVIDFIREFLIYEELTVSGKKYLLVHAGLGNYSPEKEIEDYSLKELIWNRAAYDIQYFPDVYVVTGHTPTQYIEENPKPGYIYRANNHIAIDCGCFIPGGRLGAICLDTGEEYYV